MKPYPTPEETRSQVQEKLEEARRDSPIVSHALHLVDRGEITYEFALEITTVALAEQNSGLQSDLLTLLRNYPEPVGLP